jgi:DNA polymerase I-like protein with 3'-5' exonuclease and polymerase domains
MNGYVRIPTGRQFNYTPERSARGDLKWPITTIKNYSVQGYSADLMMIARISAWRRLREQGLFIGTVHDDLELDVVNNAEVCYNISTTLEKAFEDIPANVKRIYGYDMKVPMQGEVSFGQNLKEMTKFNRNLGKEQFNVCI